MAEIVGWALGASVVAVLLIVLWALCGTNGSVWPDEIR